MFDRRQRAYICYVTSLDIKVLIINLTKFGLVPKEHTYLSVKHITEVQLWSVNIFCHQKVQQAGAIQAKLDERGLIYRRDTLRRLAVLAARDKRNLDEALKHKKELYVCCLRLFWAVYQYYMTNL